MEEIILFASSASRTCVPCLRFLSEHRLPINVVLLDSPLERERAQTGTLFQIVNVPSLLVHYSDGNLQIFEGTRKIMSWLTGFEAHLSTQQKDDDTPVILDPNEEDVESPVEIVFLENQQEEGEDTSKLAGMKKQQGGSAMNNLIEEAKRMERLRAKAVEKTGEEQRKAASHITPPRISRKLIRP